jgi:hypothetical protein
MLARRQILEIERNRHTAPRFAREPRGPDGLTVRIFARDWFILF